MDRTWCGVASSFAAWCPLVLDSVTISSEVVLEACCVRGVSFSLYLQACACSHQIYVEMRSHSFRRAQWHVHQYLPTAQVVGCIGSDGGNGKVSQTRSHLSCEREKLLALSYHLQALADSNTCTVPLRYLVCSRESLEQDGEDRHSLVGLSYGSCNHGSTVTFVVVVQTVVVHADTFHTYTTVSSAPALPKSDDLYCSRDTFTSCSPANFSGIASRRCRARPIYRAFYPPDPQYTLKRPLSH